MIKLVIFDFGDTLSNAKKSNITVQAMCPEIKIFKKHGYNFSKTEMLKAKEKTEQLYRKSDYLEQQKNKYLYMKILFDVLRIKGNKEFYDECEKVFWEERIKQTKLMPNAKTTLKKLKLLGLKLAVITNSKENHNRRIAKEKGILELFDEFIMTHKFGSVKSELKIFEHTLEKFPNIKAEECLMVGNNLNEDTSAKKIGIKTAILKTNLISNNLAEKIEPDYYINDLKEILSLIKK
jgi:FMN phosphatase YigB (HAD superfamily)